MVSGAQPLRAPATEGLADPPPMSAAANSSARVPKLAVRNRTTSTSQSSDSRSQPSSVSDRRPSHSSHTPRDRRPTDASSRSASSSIPSQTSHAQTQPPKKKKAGVFSFLTLKEPSTSALEEYAATQRTSKPSAHKTTVGMGGISSQKLPQHVPKVNSKWDGLPDGAREKLEHEGLGSKRGSKRFSGQTWGTYRTNNSSSDGASSSQGRGHGSVSALSGRSPGVSQRPSTQVERPGSAGRALEDGRVGAGAVHPAVCEATAGAETPKSGSAETPALDLPDMGGTVFDLPDLAGYEAAAYIATSDEGSPLTPPAETEEPPAIPLEPTRSKSDIQYEAYSDTAAYQPGTDEDSTWYAEHSVIRTYRNSMSVKSDGERDLEDETEGFGEEVRGGEWPLCSPDPRPESQASALTTTTATAMNTDFTAPSSQGVRTSMSYRTLDTEVTRPMTAISKGSTTHHDAQNDDGCQQEQDQHQGLELELGPQRSNSDTSVAPSMLSAQWNLTPKERLGLGGKVRRSQVLPWEQEGPEDMELGDGKGRDGKRMSAMTTGSAGGKKNRLSAMLGRK